MRHVALALASWACLVRIGGGSFLRKDDPILKAQEIQAAKEYQEKWEGKPWESAKHSCDTSKLPRTTDKLIFNICGKDQEKKRCVCNIAKAHSCHVGCRKIHFVCPKQCQEKSCYAGDPKNGGQQMSKGGHKGTCHKFCSAAGWGARYCGEGPLYQTGLFLDCTGCVPRSVKALSEKEKKGLWTKCMTNCFPTPTCSDMCGEGTPDCYARCVDSYSHVVEPYWDLFKGSLEAVPLIGEAEEVVKDEAAEKNVAEEAAEAEAAAPVKKKSVEEEEMEDEFEDGEYDEEDEDDGEYVDPWAGENEWEDDEGFLLHGVRKVGQNGKHAKGKRKRRRSPEMVKALKQARALGLRD